MRTAVKAALKRPRPSLSLDFTGGAALDSRITFTRATSAWYFDSAGTLTEATSGNARFDYDPTTAVWNYIRNTMQGAAAGSPGTLPTNWSAGGFAGLTQTVVGSGTANGVSYIDIRWAGITGGVFGTVWFETATSIGAVSGQTWAQSSYLALVGGSKSNVTHLRQGTDENTSVPAVVRQNFGVTDVGSLTNDSTRWTDAFTLSGGATVAYVRPWIQLNWSNGVAVDITLRIGMPQLELAATAGPVVATSGAAAGAYATPRGLLVEEQRSNLMLWSRDLTNAAWTTKTTITPLADQIGIDRAANSASSLLATGNGATIAQTITQAATSSTLTFYLKRLIGTGTITIKQGATTLDVTASLNMSTWTRVTLTASVLNPAIGIVMATSGDKIAVDCGQFEVGAFATSVIPTSTAAATRNADVAVISTLTPWFNAAEGTIVAQWQTAQENAAGVPAVASFDDGTINNRIVLRNGAGGYLFTVTNATVAQAAINPAVWSSAVVKMAAYYATNNFQAAVNGTLGTADSAGTIPTVDRLSLGRTGTQNYLNGWLQGLTYFPRRLSDAQLQARST